MAVSPSEISFNLSGGAGNTDPNASLGGEPSVTTVTSDINNLFDDVASTESESGKTEYRAIYIFNNNTTSAIGGVKVWTVSQVLGGATVEIGITLQDEVQKITITPQNDITGGTFQIQISYFISDFGIIETTDAISWDADFDVLAQNIEDALNDLDKFSTISVAKVGSDAVFNVTFTGNDGNKKQPTLSIVNNMLTSTGDSPEIAVELVTSGSPIETIADDIGAENIPPTGITFTDPDSEASALEIGRLAAAEGFPVWVKRIVNPGTSGLAADGFTLRFKGSSPS